MKVLLKIGYTEILLPDDTGLATLMKTLSRGLQVNDYSYHDGSGKIVVEGEARIEMKYLPRGTKIVAKKPAPEPGLLALEEPKSIIV